MTSPLAGAVEVIPRRLYWTDRTNGVVPEDTATHHFFSIDAELLYEPFCEDFGPLHLGAVHKYVTMVDSMLRSPGLEGKCIVHVTSQEPNKRANSACLICLYQVVSMAKPASLAFRPFSSVHPPFRPFRDASRGPSVFDVTIVDCLEGMQRAVELGWYSHRAFDADGYELLARVDHCDANWIIPNKFLAFTGPAPVSPDANGVPVFMPEDCAEVFHKIGVQHVVRLNTQEYDRRRFIDNGIRHTDLYFLDGSCPPPEIVSQFLRITEAEPGPVAVHCKAGLGRTCTLIGLYALKHCRFPARAFIGWARICRPGSVLGPQQQFLLDVEADMHLLREQQARAAMAKREQVPRPVAMPSPERANAPEWPAILPRGAQAVPAWRVQPVHQAAYMQGDFGQGEHLVGAKRRGYGAPGVSLTQQEPWPADADRAAAAVAGAVKEAGAAITGAFSCFLEGNGRLLGQPVLRPKVQGSMEPPRMYAHPGGVNVRVPCAGA